MVTHAEREQELRDLMRAVDPNEPISPRDVRYFDFYQAKGEPRGPDPIADLRATVRLGENKSTCQLFSGFRGTGKSTELNRLADELREVGFPVLLVKGEDVLNLHQPLEPADLLVSVAAAVAETIEQMASEDPAARSLLVRIAEFFTHTNVDLTEAGVGVAAEAGGLKVNVAQLKLQLRRSLSFKARVQNALRQRFVQFEAEFRKFMAEAKALLDTTGGTRAPVLIMDDLEKLRGIGADQDIIQRGGAWVDVSWPVRKLL